VHAPDNLGDRIYDHPHHPTNEAVQKRTRERMEEIKRRRPQASQNKPEEKT
jgi:hypothetical protein